jgi:hypothetical protein
MGRPFAAGKAFPSPTIRVNCEWSGDKRMLTRRGLLVVFAITVAPAGLRAMQGDKQPKDDQVTTVTLTIDGMT